MIQELQLEVQQLMEKAEKAAETVDSKAEAGATQVGAAVEKRGHHRSVEELERKEDPKEPEADASRPTPRKPWNQSIALAGTLRDDVLSPTAC